MSNGDASKSWNLDLEDDDDDVGVGEEEHIPTNMRQLSNKVMTAAKSSRQIRRHSTNLSQLNLANMHLHGREEDMNILKSKLRSNIINNDADNDSHELLLIAGISGTGKTALVKRGLEDPAKKMGIEFASGKFDLNKSSALPLSAFAAAMASLTKHVMGSNRAHIILGAIKEALTDADMARLVSVMPGCEELFTVEGSNRSLLPDDNNDSERGPPPSTDLSAPIGSAGGRYSRRTNRLSMGLTESVKNAYKQSSTSASGVGKAAVQKFQYAIRLLLRVICSNLKGVVLFIDDLQWSDVATIELLNSLITDKDIPSLLVVGAYREDEVSDSHPLMLQIKHSEAEGVKITTLKIGNLSPNYVEALVAEALRMEDNEEAVNTLATTIHKKTGGNAFFVLVFLKSLHDEELLQFNFGSMRWIWDDDVVKSKLVTENVATILSNKLKRFSGSMQTVLRTAACLGARVSEATVALVIGELYSQTNKSGSGINKSDTESSVLNLIIELVGEGLLEDDLPGHRRFSHDQIQSAAFQLIPCDRRDSFRGQIGDILIQNMNSEQLDENLFVVVSLRNYAISSMSEEGRHELARMNLQAGLKASRNAAFDTAVIYYRTGRELLGANGWEHDEDAMLQLCSEEANACFINGDLFTMKLLIDEVLRQDITIEKKFKAYEIKILSHNKEPDFEASIDTAIEVRRQLGLPTPANKPTSALIVLKEYFKTSRVLGNLTPEEIASLPKLESEKIIMGQRMLELLLAPTYQAQPTMYPLISFLLVRASIKHGINASSCDAFSTFGLLLCGAFGGFKRGRDMGRATELLLENPEHQRMQSRSCFHIETLIHHWTAPLQLTLAPMLAGYQIGLEIGDIESAATCLAFRSSYLLYAARPLSGALHELQTSVDVLGSQLKHQSMRHCVLPFLLEAKKLRGVPTCAGDEVKSFDDVLELAAGNNMCRALTIITHIELCVLFQDMDTAMNRLEKSGNLAAVVPGFFSVARLTFLEGLVHLKAAQTTTSWQVRRKHSKRAKKSMKLIRSWLKSGNVNVLHSLHLLTAEHAVLTGNKSVAEEQFKSAISVASTNGFIQDRGMAHELAGKYYASQGDTYWVRYHLERAELSFTDWGATAKVEKLRETKRQTKQTEPELNRLKKCHVLQSNHRNENARRVYYYAREKAFRDYFANHELRRKLSATTSTSTPSSDQWDAVLDPPKNPTKPFRPFKSYVRGLIPLSSQLTNKCFGEFTTEYPLGPDTKSILDKPKDDRPRYSGTWNGHQVSARYDAKVDAALIIEEFDLALVGNVAIDKKQFHESRCISEGEGSTSHKCRVPSLQTLAGQVLQPTLEKLQDAYEEEKRFAHSLYAAVQDARQQFEGVVEKHQKLLQESNEANEVKAIRLLLQQAEHRLAEKQHCVEKDMDKDREEIQSEFDRTRAGLAMAYIEKRDSILSMSPGIPNCQGCTKPFSPQINRDELAGWERCSVPECSSSARFCVDCSAVPCRRCFAPLCTIHQTPHELVCRVECEKLCGFKGGITAKKGRAYHRRLKKWITYTRVGMKEHMDSSAGCCGKNIVWYRGRGRGWCSKCGVKVCGECLVQVQLGESEYCPRCSPTENGHCSTNLQCMKWGAPEHAYERDRKRQKMEEFKIPDGECPPFERLMSLCENTATRQQNAKSGAAGDNTNP